MAEAAGQPKSLSRYRSLRSNNARPNFSNAPPVPDTVPVPQPANSMAAAAASASLQRSQSRYHRPARPIVPQQRPTDPQPPHTLRKATTFPAPENMQQQIRKVTPVSRNERFHSPPPATNSVRKTSARQEHLHNDPEHPDVDLRKGPAELARAEARQLLELEAKRQADMKERMRAQREHAARVEADRLLKERKRQAVAQANEKEQIREEEIRKEAQRLKMEKDAAAARLKAQREKDESDQDKRIKALARARYEEKQIEWARQEREQQAQHERDVQHRRDKREARRQVKRQPSDLLGSQSQVNALLNIPSFRRRESDGLPALDRKSSTEAFTRVFTQRRREAQPARPKVTVGTSYDQVSAGDAPTPVESIKKDELPKFIKPGGGGIVPGTDAPVSAVNSGERRVIVKCNEAFISLPITPTTTPIDLIFSAANCLAENIDPSKSVLLELFAKVGIQRPLRRYEHVRDVMNSWDDDKQNSLHIISSTTDGNDRDLDSAFVPSEQPSDASFTMYYSQKPGKWEKRYITLRTDGQVVQAKKSSSKDFTKICHMSDFDLYTPMPDALQKKVVPPKKHCFCIKSQQKSSMFMSSEDFVHFFSTNSFYDATAFYSSVQGWRSWYLVHVMGEGQKSRLQPTNAGTVDTETALNTPDNRNSHYQLGSFKPLLDFDSMFGASEHPQATSDMPQHRQTKDRSTSGAKPPSHRPSSSSQGHRPSTGRSSEQNDSSTFAPSGLLGRTYSVRQAEVQAKARQPQTESLFTSGSLMSEIDNVLNGQKHDTNLRRQSSRHSSTQKPLIDLTPGRYELPQHSKKGKGFHPEHVGAGGLIDSATTPEGALDLSGAPPALDWRHTAHNDPSLGRGKSIRRSNSQYQDRNSVNRSSMDPSPFAADGLIASISHSQGGQKTGRGVRQGSDAQGPMLDMREQSQFAQGSLLQQAEEQHKFGDTGPIIDRSRGREEVIRTGEGY